MEERIRERYRKYQEEQKIRLKVTFDGFDSDYSFDGDPYECDDICETFRINYSIDDERRDFGHNTIDGGCRYINLMIAEVGVDVVDSGDSLSIEMNLNADLCSPMLMELSAKLDENNYAGYSGKPFIFVNWLYVHEGYQNIGVGTHIIKQLPTLISTHIDKPIGCIFWPNQPETYEREEKLSNEELEKINRWSETIADGYYKLDERLRVYYRD
ncbi:hypothetical protein SAMN04487835_101116 [Sharpea azabuensis]|uniref:hypothetical protein n=1 Tax=Sharpea azabuensis TaxID=322505 RepID=UPI0008E446EC|nr:hypothetical protein [Sharpea azabuensis]SFD44471.1 hypothetical protein SAMN04487836_101116 [Sharpea azabuensis]SFK47119.1 hypothetical protein SAMN04487835_101116 [Sharpea azabuensis]